MLSRLPHSHSQRIQAHWEDFLRGGKTVKIPAYLSYAKNTVFQRKATLPEAHPFDLKFRSAEAEKTFFWLMFEGELTMEWKILCTDNTNEELVLTVQPGEDDERTAVDSLKKGPLNYLEGLGDFLFTNGISPCEEGTGCKQKCNISTGIQNLFSDSQLEALFLRVVHRFFRQFAAVLPTNWQDNVTFTWQEQYKARKWYSELCDLHQISLDASFANEENGKAVNAMMLYGDALRLRGKFGRAALVYSDIIQLLPLLSTEGYSLEQIARKNLAKACYQDCNWGATEQAFVAALWAVNYKKFNV